MPVLEVCDVYRSFAGRPPVDALRGVSFSAAEGEVLGLLGTNGAGKTTLVKILSTLLLPTRGTARICGHDVVGERRAAQRCLSVVFGGERGLYIRLSALDNLLFLGGLSGIRRGLRHRASAALDRVGLGACGGQRVETFSRGMRQRLHLAIGLLTTPRLLLLDEPTVGLDVVEAQRIRGTIAELAGSHAVTVLLTSHYPVDIEQLASRVILLDNGVVRHDLPIATFRRLAGFTAEVRVSGRGSPPEVTGHLHDHNVELGVVDNNDGWLLVCRVRQWDARVLTDLAAVVNTSQVDDIVVHPAGIDTVLASMFTHRG